MSINSQTQADQNIQYRVFLACVKEQLFPEDTDVQIGSNQIEVRRHQYYLAVPFQTASALYQFTFNGPITFKATTTTTIESLGELIDILTTYFDIPFHQRLIDELDSSSKGLALSYEQLHQRQTTMQHSLKFSKLPNTLNFFSWLIHMNGERTFSGLGYTEGMVWEGHPSHPLTKTKLPLTQEEIQRYAPEFMKIIPLRIVLIHRDDLIETTMEPEQQFILNEIIPEKKSELKRFLEPLNATLDHYRVMFVHPWQYDNVITEVFADKIETLRLIPTPFTVDSRATLSFRTMALVDKPYHIKLPVNVQATSAVRTVSTVTTVDGPTLSYQLQDMLERYDSLRAAKEPYGAYINVDQDTARQLAMIVRFAPNSKNEDALQVVTAALTQINPVDHQVTVDSLIEYLYDNINKDSIQQFVRDYASQLIPPLIAYIQSYGIALEAHQQNTVLEIHPTTHAFTFMVRDLGGARIHPETIKQSVPNIDITNKSLIAEDITDVVAKFQHAVIQNQFGTLIHHFHHAHEVSESTLYTIVHDVIKEAIDDRLPHAETLRDILFGETLTVKALLNMRLKQQVKKYVQIQLDNPIKDEV
ncbi:IucA/IucC family protein [Staphylococcus sp. 11262D007BW]